MIRVIAAALASWRRRRVERARARRDVCARLQIEADAARSLAGSAARWSSSLADQARSARARAKGAK